MSEKEFIYQTGNHLTEEQEEILGILQEEAAEVIQELSKLRRSGPNFCRKGTDVTNMTHLQNELMDFSIMLGLAIEAELIIEPSYAQVREYEFYKTEKLKKWSKLNDLIQRIQG